MNVVAITEITFIATKPVKGSQFVKSYNVERNGVPFAKVSKFNAANGGNWYVGFAKGNEGGRADTFEAAELIVRFAA
jgi:hypothetical protein